MAHEICPCGKRGFADEQDADKALGRARTLRNRTFDRNAPSRRGMVRENRYYECHEDGGLLHLTSQSRRENQSRRNETQVMSWEDFLSQNGAAA